MVFILDSTPTKPDVPEITTPTPGDESSSQSSTESENDDFNEGSGDKLVIGSGHTTNLIEIHFPMFFSYTCMFS